MNIFDQILEILRGLASDKDTPPKDGPFADITRDLKPRKPLDGFMEAIAKWEGEWQQQWQDVGNYVVHPTKGRLLIGTMRGVTPAAYALWKGIPPYEVTRQMMKTEITLEVAAKIGLKNYFRGPGFDRLPWCPAVEVYADYGWGSGPHYAIKKLQRMVRVGDDGVIGPITVQAFSDWLREHGHETAVRMIRDERESFYERIAVGAKSIYLNGWLRRARYYSPSNTDWWSKWV